MDEILSFRLLNLTLGDKTFFQNAKAQIYAGDTIALIGQSGSGKSLLLQILADLLPADTGTVIEYCGQNIHQIPPNIYRQHVTLINQEISLIPETVLDNLKFPFSFACHQDKHFCDEFHLNALRFLGKSADFLDKKVTVLSGGEKQIVNLLRTLQFSPDILLCDEITSALDPKTANLVLKLILNWQKDNKALIWITHTPEQIRQFADMDAKLWQIDNGQLLTNEVTL